MKVLTAAFAVAVAAACATTAAAAPRDEAVKAYFRKHGDDKVPGDPPERLSIAWTDLNGDGRPEALALFRSGLSCGSGGCDLIILQRDGAGFRVRGGLSVSRAPIGVLPTRRHGWRDLAVFVAGGGILQGYTAVVPFRGPRYAFNPTVPPARALRPSEHPRILIRADDRDEPLLP